MLLVLCHLVVHMSLLYEVYLTVDNGTGPGTKSASDVGTSRVKERRSFQQQLALFVRKAMTANFVSTPETLDERHVRDYINHSYFLKISFLLMFGL